jgi:uroporphyrinogen decarboxylase
MTPKMSAKERFRATFAFQPVDRPWRFETVGFWRETIARWRREGLPFWVTDDVRAYAYFGYDRWLPVVVGSDKQPGVWPPFPRVRLSAEGGHELWRNEYGGQEKVFVDGTSAPPHIVRPPVESRDDFERLLPRLDPAAPGRLETFVDRATVGYAKLFDYPLGLLYCGLFGFTRHLLGLERFLLATYDDPDLLHAIGRAWRRLCIGTAEKLARHRPIWASFWEDMCFRNGMLLSPRAYREFITPYFKDVVQRLRALGVEHTVVDSDGDVTKLIPLLEEVGIDGMMPFEVQAGMDIRAVRERHPRLVLFGGLDKRLLAQSRDAMEAEIQAKAVPLLRQGGYVPGLDHCVPPDVSLADFRWLLGRLRDPELAALGR